LDRHHTQLSVVAAAAAVEAQRFENARLSLNGMGEES
jgi:hypothetical protein